MNNRPEDLAEGGSSLWDSITGEHELDAVQLVQLTEACRMKDRLDDMDRIIQGKGVLNLLRFRCDLDEVFENPNAKVTVSLDAVIDKANSTANTMKQLLAAMRLPDTATGQRPQRRGGARGAQKPTVPGGAQSAAAKAQARWGA